MPFEQYQINELLDKHDSQKQFTDECIFILIDIRKPQEEQIPVEVCGHQARGLLQDGFYTVLDVKSNPSSSRILVEARREAQRKINAQYAPNVPVGDQLRVALERVAALESQLASTPQVIVPEPQPLIIPSNENAPNEGGVIVEPGKPEAEQPDNAPESQEMQQSPNESSEETPPNE